MKMKVSFPYYHKEFQIEAGATVKDACLAAGCKLNTACGGAGVCGKCLVIIRDHGITMQVMACQYPVSDGMEILISEDHREEQLLTEAAVTAPYPIDPIIRCFPVNAQTLIEKAKAENKSIFDILCDWLPVPLLPFGAEVEKEARDLFQNTHPLIQCHTCFDPTTGCHALYHIQPTAYLEDYYGIVFDFGTTSVTAYLLDLEDGLLIDSEGKLNAQIAYGDDVITKITYTMQHKVGVETLQQAIIDTMGRLIQKLCEKIHLDSKKITALLCCGNTAMIHFLLGQDNQDTSPLGQTPFTTPHQVGCCINATALKLPVSPIAKLITLPGLGSFCPSQ